MSIKNNTKRITFYLTLLLLGLAPFHALLITFLRHLGLEGYLNIIISSWREILLILIGLSVISCIRIGKKFLLDNLFPLLFLVLGFAFLFFQENIEKWMWGARFDLIFFFAFLVFQFTQFTKDEFKKLIKVILGAGLIVTIFGLMHALLLPQDFLALFGYSMNRDIWDITAPISACQYLEHTQKFCRAISTFGGPTRYGTYLLLLFSLSSVLFFKSIQKKERFFLGFLSVLALINIFLTFSRSIWLGLFAMIIAALLFGAILRRKQNLLLKSGVLKNFKLFFIITFIALLVFIFTTFDSLRTIFIRTSSTSEHFQLLKDGFLAFLNHPFGIGLGEAGPASLRFKKFITENWYLQIAIEMGLLGLILFLGALIQTLKNLYKKIEKNSLALGLFLALIGIGIAGLFTHSFEETSTVILLFALTGMVYQL